jgi:ASPIC and UnbV
VAGVPARSIYRQISAGSSFGRNSLAAWIDLGDTRTVESLTIDWHTRGTRQTFPDVPADRSLEITEGAATYQIFVPNTPSSAEHEMAR